MRIPLALVVLFAGLGGCASLEEAYGRPDPFDWTYFEEGSAGDVADAIQETFYQSGLRVESVREENNGLVLTVASRQGRAEFTEIRVENVALDEFTARAQIYPERAPLPRWLEIEVTGRI